MLQRPEFKPHYHAESVAGEGIVLLSEQGHCVLRGPLYERLAVCIDGLRSGDEIAAMLGDRASLTEVQQMLAELERQGCLTEGGADTGSGEAALWSIQGIAPQIAAERLRKAVVSVRALGGLAMEPFVAALRSLGVRVGDDGAPGVVLTDDYLRPELERYNAEALETGRPWMLIKPVGCEIWVGPAFRPDRTACWECLAQRLRANRLLEVALQHQKGREAPFPISRACSPATLQIACNLAAMEVAKWLAQGELPELEGRVLTFDLTSLQSRTHHLVWRPQCPACGDSLPDEALRAQPVVLESRRKAFVEDAGHRVFAPETTLGRCEHHVSPITGAVGRLESCAGLGDGVMYGYQAAHNLAVRQPRMTTLGAGLRGRSGGKGANDLQARTSGLCEALERYSGVFQGEEPRRRARMRQLGDAALHPNLCMRFSDRQYRERDAWNARHSPHHFVPSPFDEEAEMEWTPVWSLTRREARFLPTAFCYYRYPTPPGQAYCVACSNGNAAGNTLEEAVLQGFLELVERDSVALWWYNRIARPAVALESFAEPYLQKVSAYLRQQRREFWVLDLTADLQIPVFTAISRRVDQEREEIMLGFGAHLDPRIALLRAVTELNQFLLWLLQREKAVAARNAGGGSVMEEWLASATLASQPYLAPDPHAPPRLRSDYPECWTDDLRDDVRLCQSRVEQRGLEMLVLDQTRPDIGLPVAKVIVPGLRHFRARFAPGRLYDVPVELGWLPRPLAEEELNPWPMVV